MEPWGRRPTKTSPTGTTAAARAQFLRQTATHEVYFVIRHPAGGPIAPAAPGPPPNGGLAWQSARRCDERFASASVLRRIGPFITCEWPSRSPRSVTDCQCMPGACVVGCGAHPSRCRSWRRNNLCTRPWQGCTQLLCPYFRPACAAWLPCCACTAQQIAGSCQAAGRLGCKSGDGLACQEGH